LREAPRAAGEGAKLTAPHDSDSTLVTDEHFFTIGSQFAFWANKSIQRLPGDAELGAKIGDLRLWLAHCSAGKAQFRRCHLKGPPAIATTGTSRFQSGFRPFHDQRPLELRIKWHLWHGNAYRAREEIDNLQIDAEALKTDYPNMRKFLTAIGEFQSYIASNSASLINYGERYRSGERISSAFVEATVNAVISKRFAKKQQMQWSRTGAHLLLRTRTQTLDGSLRSTFRQWYPGMANDNHEKPKTARAA
jgi:hypothetical protein